MQLCVLASFKLAIRSLSFPPLNCSSFSFYMSSSISVGVHRFLCAGHCLCVYVIDSDGSLCVRINGSRPPRSEASQPFQLSRGRRARSCVRIPVYESVQMQTLSRVDNRRSHTRLPTHVCPAKYKATRSHITLKKWLWRHNCSPRHTFMCPPLK